MQAVAGGIADGADDQLTYGSSHIHLNVKVRRLCEPVSINDATKAMLPEAMRLDRGSRHTSGTGFAFRLDGCADREQRVQFFSKLAILAVYSYSGVQRVGF